MKISLFTGWLVGFSPILILAGIGFILYDFTAKEGSKNLLDYFKTEDISEIKGKSISCPYCNKNVIVPKLTFGSTGKCPHCNKKIKLKEISLPSEL